MVLSPAEAGDEVTLIHKEPSPAEEQPPVSAPLPAEPEVVAPEVTHVPDASERIGEFNVLDMDNTEDEALLPEELGGVSFTNEQLEPTEETLETPLAEAPQPTTTEAQAQPIPSPRTPPSRPAEPKPVPSQQDTHDLNQRMAQRHQSIEEYTKRLRTPSGLTELEDEPAYKRRNIQLTPTPASNDSQATRLSIDEETGGLKTDNPFLHDNVD